VAFQTCASSRRGGHATGTFVLRIAEIRFQREICGEGWRNGEMDGRARAGEVAGLVEVWTELRVGGGSRPWTGLCGV
jgi:hypothetical protein